MTTGRINQVASRAADIVRSLTRVNHVSLESATPLPTMLRVLELGSWLHCICRHGPTLTFAVLSQ